MLVHGPPKLGGGVDFHHLIILLAKIVLFFDSGLKCPSAASSQMDKFLLTMRNILEILLAEPAEFETPVKHQLFPIFHEILDFQKYTDGPSTAKTSNDKSDIELELLYIGSHHEVHTS